MLSMLKDYSSGESKMINLLRFYVREYLDVASLKPHMDDSGNSLSDAIDAYDNIRFCIDVWSIASCI